jgi:hypothetical protein
MDGGNLVPLDRRELCCGQKGAVAVDGSEAAPAGQRDLYEGKEGRSNQPPGRMGGGALLLKMASGVRENRRGGTREPRMRGHR